MIPTTTILIIAGAVILLVILCAAFDLLFCKNVSLGSIPHTPKLAIPRLPPYVNGTTTAMDITGSVMVKLILNDGQCIHLATFDSDDAGYNWLCAEELSEAIIDAINHEPPTNSSNNTEHNANNINQLG